MRQWCRQMSQSGLSVESNRNYLKQRENLIDTRNFQHGWQSGISTWKKIDRRFQRLRIRDHFSWRSQLPLDSTATMVDTATGNELPTPKEMITCWKVKQTSKQTNEIKRYGTCLLKKEISDRVNVVIQKRNVVAACGRYSVEEMDLWSE